MLGATAIGIAAGTAEAEAAAAGGWYSLTFCPDVSTCTPAVTTCMPGVNPAVITARLPSAVAT